MAEKKSIVVKDMSYCIVCGSPRVHIHHIFYGTGDRAISERYKLVIPLCMEHHTGNRGVHFNRDMDLAFKRSAQRIFEEKYSHELFMAEFGRNYL